MSVGRSGSAAAPGAVRHRTVVQHRPREVHAFRLRRAEEFRYEHGRARDERRTFQPVEFPRLPGEERAFRKEKRNEEALRSGCREFREDGGRVRVALCDPDGHGFPAECAVCVVECAHESRRVRVAVMHGPHAP